MSRVIEFETPRLRMRQWRDADREPFEAFHFDDNEPSANELAQLVLAGMKRATRMPIACERLEAIYRGAHS